MTSRKILGCAVGFGGILSLNLGGAESGHFTWLGDGMIILNAICGYYEKIINPMSAGHHRSCGGAG